MAKKLVKRYIIDSNEVRFYQGGTHEKLYISTGEIPSTLSDVMYFTTKAKAVRHLETRLLEEDCSGTYFIKECYIFDDGSMQHG